MKRIKSKLAIILMMMLIFTSFEFVGVFAEGEEGAPAETTNVEAQDADEAVAPAESTDAPAVTEEATKPEVEEVVEEVLPEEDTDTPAITKQEDETEPTKTVDAITGLATFSSFKSVVLEWNQANVVTTTPSTEQKKDEEGNPVFDPETGDPVMEAPAITKTPASYKVTASNGSVGAVSNLGNGKMRCTITGLQPGASTNFTVYAYDPNNDELKGTPASKSDAAVRTIAYKFTVKSSTTLKSHAGPKRTYKLKKGQTLTCDRFGGGGCYMFYYPPNAANPSTFYCAKIRAKNIKAIYTKDWNYSTREAEFYVNAKGLKSKTGKLLWVNSYTQHIYYFTGPKNTAGQWVCEADWECATGKAGSPSPTGITGVKKILRKVKKHHGIQWWLPYSEWNSVHGQRKGWKFGKPASHGCIRNPIKKMAWLYKQIPVGTTLNVY